MISEKSPKKISNNSTDEPVELLEGPKILEALNIGFEKLKLSPFLGVNPLDLPQCLCTDGVSFTVETIHQYQDSRKCILARYEPRIYSKFLKSCFKKVCCKNLRNGHSLVTNEVNAKRAGNM